MKKQIEYKCPFCKKTNTPEIDIKSAYFFTELLRCDHCVKVVYLSIVIKAEVLAEKP